MSIRKYMLVRVLQAIPLLLGVIVVNFIIIHAAPGDPTLYIIGEASVDQEFIDRLKEAMGLNRPLYQQLGIYLAKVATGNLGYSYVSSATVLDLILERFPPTLLLMGSQYVLSIIMGISLGVLSARKPYSLLDSSVTILSLVGYAMPLFWLGQMLLLIFGFQFGWFPIQGIINLRAGYTGIAYALDVLHHLALPALTLGLFNMAIIVRLTRANMLQVMGQDFIMLARSKGVSEKNLLLKHSLRNALLPVVTIVGLHFRFLVAGAVLTETVFGWPGLGRLTYDAIYARDYPLLMGMFIFICIMVIIGNLITDFIYSYLDPRIRYR